MVVELGIGKKSASERGDQRGLEASGIIKMQRQSPALVAATRPRRPRGRLSGNLPIKLLRCCSSSSADSGAGWSQKATGGAIAAPLGIAELQLLPGHARATYQLAASGRNAEQGGRRSSTRLGRSRASRGAHGMAAGRRVGALGVSKACRGVSHDGMPSGAGW